MGIKDYLKDNGFRLTPLEFIALVNSSQDIIQNILLQENNATYTIVTKDGNKMNVEIVEETPTKRMILQRESK